MSADAVHLAEPSNGPRNWSERLLRWLPDAKVADALAILLTGAALAAGVATFLALSGAGPLGADATATQILLIIDLLLVLGLSVLVGFRLVRLWRAHRARPLPCSTASRPMTSTKAPAVWWLYSDHARSASVRGANLSSIGMSASAGEAKLGRRGVRRATTSAGTSWSAISAASVPGRGE